MSWVLIFIGACVVFSSGVAFGAIWSGLMRANKQADRLYVMETSVGGRLFNLDDEGVEQVSAINKDANFSWRVRPMTDDEMQQYARD